MQRQAHLNTDPFKPPSSHKCQNILQTSLHLFVCFDLLMDIHLSPNFAYYNPAVKDCHFTILIVYLYDKFLKMELLDQVYIHTCTMNRHCHEGV